MFIPPMPPRDDRPAGDRCEVTLRDTFAAAALTGLLVNANFDIDEDTLDTPSDLAYTAYEMADAMLRERLRSGAASSCETVRAVTEPLPKEKPAEVSAEPLCRRPQLTLTNEEREAVKSAIWDYEQNDDDADCASMAAILRGLLERTATQPSA